MDRFEAMKVFVTAVEAGSLAAASRRLKRSPAAVSRAIAALEGRIEELRNFEREYRSKLKGYIEGQLRELDSTSEVLTGAGAPAAVSAGAAQGQNYAAQIAPPPADYPGFAGN